MPPLPGSRGVVSGWSMTTIFAISRGSGAIAGAGAGNGAVAPGAVIPGIRNINGHRASAQQQTVFRHNAPDVRVRLGESIWARPGKDKA